MTRLSLMEQMAKDCLPPPERKTESFPLTTSLLVVVELILECSLILIIIFFKQTLRLAVAFSVAVYAYPFR